MSLPVRRPSYQSLAGQILLVISYDQIKSLMVTTSLNFFFLILLLGALGLRCFAWPSLVVASRGYSWLCCGSQASHCSGFSCCRAHAPGTWASAVAVLGLGSCGSNPRLWSEGSVAVEHGLSGSAACGIFSDQGLNSCPLLWQAGSYPPCHQGSPLLPFLNVQERGVGEWL